ncbi:glyoxalase, partial [Escherichia coli]|nr:glyoxalase [Escherichia coli]
MKAQALAHLIFERPDLDKAARFLGDFGLHPVRRDADCLYLRGTGSAPYCYRVAQAGKARFVGFGLVVAERGDLERLSALPGASAIES